MTHVCAVLPFIPLFLVLHKRTVVEGGVEARDTTLGMVVPLPMTFTCVLSDIVSTFRAPNTWWPSRVEPMTQLATLAFNRFASLKHFERLTALTQMIPSMGILLLKHVLALSRFMGPKRPSVDFQSQFTFP